MNKTTAPLIKLSLPDPARLKAALAAIDDHAAKLKNLADEKARLEKTMEEFFNSEDAVDNDPEMFIGIAGTRTRIENIPGIIERVKARRYALADTLTGEVGKFEQALAAEGLREREAVLDSIEAEIRHRVPGAYFADGTERSYARLLASQFPELASIPWLPSQLNAPKLFTGKPELTWGEGEAQRDFNFKSTVEAAARRAQALLGIHAQVSEAGRFGDTVDAIREGRKKELAEEKQKHQARLDAQEAVA